MDLSRKSKLPHWVAVSGLLIFSFLFSYELIFLKRYLNHPEYVHYYHAFRLWFLKNLTNGHFPQWNPYWGLGHSTEIEASFPVDIYTFLELIFGDKYHWFQWLQCFLILVSGYWCFNTLGIPSILALVGSLSFFLSPWVNYFFFYFIKANSFIGLFLSFPLILKWLQTANKKFLPWLALATVFTMSGTKLDFWFFHFCFVGLFSLIFSWQIKVPRSRLYWLVATLALGIIAQSWQWITLIQILGVSDRIGNHFGLTTLLMGEFYYNLIFSIASSAFIKTSICTFFFYKSINSTKRGSIFWVGLGGITILICKLWQTPVVHCLLTTEYGLGLLVGISLYYLFERPNLREMLTASLLFIPLANYWGRPLPGDLNELTILRSAPFGLKLISTCLCYLGCTSILKNRTLKTTYLCLLILFFLRDQGQIFLSYFFGLVWIPTRDNFIFEFLLALLGVSGIALLKTSRRYGFILIPVLILSPIKNFYYSHPLIETVKEPYPVYQGDPELNSLLISLRRKPTDRTYFLGKHYAGGLSMYGSSLLTETNQVHLFSSFMPKLYHDWSVYQWFGFRPEDHWSSYEGEYSNQTISKLPFRDTKGIHTNHVYWYALHAAPPPKLNTLKFVGVNRIISEDPIPSSPEFIEPMKSGKYYAAKLRDTLPKAFSIALSEKSKKIFESNLEIPLVGNQSLQFNSIETPYVPASIVAYENERIVIETENVVRSQLVLTDLHHPFWRARVNGIPVPIKPAFALFRSIEIPEGKHRVEFYCEIPFLGSTFILSGIAWFVIVSISG